MAHVNESDASAAADSTAFRVRTSAFASRSLATTPPGGYVVPSFAPAAPALASGEGQGLPAGFGMASAR